MTPCPDLIASLAQGAFGVIPQTFFFPVGSRSLKCVLGLAFQRFQVGYDSFRIYQIELELRHVWKSETARN